MPQASWQLWLLIMLALACIGQAQGPGMQTAQTIIKIGQTAALTTNGTNYGTLLQAGMALAFNQSNANGGIYGKNVTLITLDDGYDATVGLANMVRLVETDNVLLLAGVTGSEVVSKAYSYLTNRSVPYVGPFSGITLLRSPFVEEFVNVRASYFDEILMHVAFLIQYMKVKRIACFYQNDDFGWTGIEAVKTALAYVGLKMVASGSYAVGTTEVSAAVAAIAGASQKPQAVVLIALQDATIKFIHSYRKDSRVDPDCLFTVMSVGATASFASELGSAHWYDVFLFQVVPVPGDSGWQIAQKFDTLYRATGKTPDATSFEGYVVGRFILEVLKGIGRAPIITGDMFLDFVYNTRLFVLDDLLVGMYSRNYTGCSDALCACNTGLRTIFFTMPNPETGELIQGLPNIRYPVIRCANSVDVILPPVIFGQLIPKDDAVWESLARYIGTGISDAFAAANTAGGINGREFLLVQQEYSEYNATSFAYGYSSMTLMGINTTTVVVLPSLNGSIVKISDRYPLVGMLGSVLNSSEGVDFTVPAMGTFDTLWDITQSAFSEEHPQVQPSTALEIMALVNFATYYSSNVHLRAPDTPYGQATLQLLVKSIHSVQYRPASSSTYTTAADEINEKSSGWMIFLGSDADVKAAFLALEKAPQLHLLTVGSSALHLLASSDYSSLSQASRFHFPSLTIGSWTAPVTGVAASEAYKYGYLAAQAAIQALQRSEYASKSYNTAEQLLNAWYAAKVMTYNGISLGTYTTMACTYSGQTECECDEGARTLGFLDATGAASNYTYTSLTCHVVYQPLQDNTVLIGAIVGCVGGLSGILFITWCVLLRTKRNNSAAPKDEKKPFCILFTDIQSSTHLWASIPDKMAIALNVHHDLIRKLIAKYKCYEVKTIGDSFMCATHTPIQAVQFALAIQRKFYEYDWGSDAIDDVYKEVQEGTYRTDCWSGLRVRVGIHYGLGEIKLDEVSKGYDYYGTVVNTAARIESVCHGGQIGVSQAVYDALNGELPDSVWSDLGWAHLRGLSEPLHLHQILPSGALSGRTFPPLRIENESAKVEDLQEEQESLEGTRSQSFSRSSNKKGSIAPCSTINTATENLKWVETHPLVLKGDITADELKKHYQIILVALSTLFSTQVQKFTESVLQSLCERLNVRNYGVNGAMLQRTLGGLVHRILPATVIYQQQQEPSASVTMSPQAVRQASKITASPSRYKSISEVNEMTTDDEL